MPPNQNCSLVSSDNEIRSRGSTEEECVTKKKVEITTTKNIETKVFRQFVLEDGRVLDEEEPIRSREVEQVLREKTNIGKYIQTSDREEYQVLSEPRIVFKDRKHHIVTDKEDVQERNWIHGGKLKQERTVTEEHIEYDSHDSACSSSSSESSRSSHYQLRPEEYKTKTEESFTEYFVKGKGDEKLSLVKLDDEPHYKSEYRMSNKADEDCWIQEKNNQLTQPSHKQLTQLRSLDSVTKKTVRRGFGGSGLSNSTNDLSILRTFEENGSLRASSANDVRGDGVEENVYIAKVIQNEETPSVKMRKKKTNLNYYKIADQDSSPIPIRPPRTKEYVFPNCRIAESQKQRLKPTRPHSVDLSECFHYNDSALTQSRSKDQISSSQALDRTFHSTQDLSEEHKHSRQDNSRHDNSRHDNSRHDNSRHDNSRQHKHSGNANSRQHKHESENRQHLFPSLRNERSYHSTQNLSSEHINNPQSRHSSNSHYGHNNENSMASKSHVKHFPSLSLGRNYHSTQNLSEKSSCSNNIERPRSVIFSLEEPIRVKANYTLVTSPKTHKQHHQVKNLAKDSTKHYHSTGNIYKSVITERSSHDEHKPHHLSIEDVSQCRSSISQGSMGRGRKSSGQLIFSSKKPKARIGSEFSKNSSCTTLTMPREQSRRIPIEIYSSSAPMTPLGSPSTKYKTRVFVN